MDKIVDESCACVVVTLSCCILSRKEEWASEERLSQTTTSRRVEKEEERGAGKSFGHKIRICQLASLRQQGYISLFRRWRQLTTLRVLHRIRRQTIFHSKNRSYSSSATKWCLKFKPWKNKWRNYARRPACKEFQYLKLVKSKYNNWQATLVHI